MTLKQALREMDVNTEVFVILAPKKKDRKLAIRAQIPPEYFNEVRDGLEQTLSATRIHYDNRTTED